MGPGPLLDRVQGDTLSWMDNEGGVQVAHTFSPPDDLYSFSISSGRSGSFFAAVGFGFRYDNGVLIYSDPYTELVLFDAEGERLAWIDTVSGYSEGAWLNSDGILSYAPGYEDFSAHNPRMNGVILYPDGRLEELEGWSPIGEVVEGRVPVCDVDDETLCGWYLDGSVAATQVTRPVSQYGDKIVWLDGENVSIWRMGEAPTVLSLPAAESLQITDQQAGTLLISGTFGDDADPPWEPVARVDLELGQVEPIPFRPPDGWHSQDFSYCNVPVGMLSADAEVLFPFVGEEGAQLWRSADGESWTPMGDRYSGNVGLGTGVVGETVQVIGVDMTNTFCVYETVEGPGALHAGDVQVLRGDVAVVIEDPWTSWPAHAPGHLTPDGSCLLDESFVHHLETGVVQQLPELGFSWISSWGL
jgi:hypothetical protein